MVRILVMGGSRFIGKHLLHKLAENSENSILVANRGSIPNEEYLPEGVDHVVIDRKDEKSLGEGLQGESFDLVYDVSGITFEDSSMLLDALDPLPQRLVYVSSGAVYDLYRENGPLPELPITEEFPVGPINDEEMWYMNAKRGGEKANLEAYEEGKLEVVIVRPTFVYGPDNYIYREAYFFDRIEQGRPIPLPNDGHAFIDLVHVDDLADLLILAGSLPAEQVNGQFYNGSKGDVITANLYARLCADIMGKEAELVYYDPAELQEMKWPQVPQHGLYPYRSSGGVYQSSRKVEHELDFTSQMSYRKGLTTALEWWREYGQRREDFTLEETLVSYLQADDDQKEKKRELMVAQISVINEQLEKEKEESTS